jgi:hypothetical protein
MYRAVLPFSLVGFRECGFISVGAPLEFLLMRLQVSAWHYFLFVETFLLYKQRYICFQRDHCSPQLPYYRPNGLKEC